MRYKAADGAWSPYLHTGYHCRAAGAGGILVPLVSSAGFLVLSVTNLTRGDHQAHSNRSSSANLVNHFLYLLRPSSFILHLHIFLTSAALELLENIIFFRNVTDSLLKQAAVFVPL